MASNNSAHDTGIASSNVSGTKRKSRFDSVVHPVNPDDGFSSQAQPTTDTDAKKLNIDLSAATLKASELSKALSNKVTSNLLLYDDLLQLYLKIYGHL